MDQPHSDAACIEAAFERVRSGVLALREEIEHVIIGQRQVIDELLCSVVAGGHVLLEGVPGTGKTRMVATFAQAAGLDMGRIQFTPDLMPADITGTTIVADARDSRRGMIFRPGPVFNQVVLADEINRAAPRTQAALLEAMQEHTVTVGGTTHQLPEPFIVLATQNPIDQEGVYRLPEAQLDRFMMKILVASPSEEAVGEIIASTTGGSGHTPRSRIKPGFLEEAAVLARGVIVAPHVNDWISRLVLATGDEALGGDLPALIQGGCSPRAGIAVRLTAQVSALCDGRLAASCSDVRRVLGACLRHRTVPGPEARGRGLTPDDLIDMLLAHVPAPAEEVLER